MLEDDHVIQTINSTVEAFQSVAYLSRIPPLHSPRNEVVVYLLRFSARASSAAPTRFPATRQRRTRPLAFPTHLCQHGATVFSKETSFAAYNIEFIMELQKTAYSVPIPRHKERAGMAYADEMLRAIATA